MRLSILPLADDFEVAYVAPAVRSLEADATFVLPVEGEFPKELHLLDAVQKVLAVLRILNGIPDLDHRAVSSVPEVAECLRDSVRKVKVDFCVGHVFVRLGTFQLSDIFYNTVGGVIGGLMYCAVMKARKRL